MIVVYIHQHYADPVIDLIDVDACVSRRYFRSACTLQHGNFLKDITEVREDLSQVRVCVCVCVHACVRSQVGVCVWVHCRGV